MAPVQATDNIHVVTQNRGVGSAAQSGEVQLRAASGMLDMVENPVVQRIDATYTIPAAQFATTKLHALIECAQQDAKLTLRAKLFSKDVVVPLTLNASGAFEANFTLGDRTSIPEGEALPDMLCFAVVRDDGDRNTTHGMLFIAVRK